MNFKTFIFTKQDCSLEFDVHSGFIASEMAKVGYCPATFEDLCQFRALGLYRKEGEIVIAPGTVLRLRTSENEKHPRRFMPFLRMDGMIDLTEEASGEHYGCPHLGVKL